MAEHDDNVIPESIGERLLAETRAVAPDADAAARIKRKLLARVRGETPADDTFTTVTEAAGDWIETSPGNRIKILRSDADTMSMLVRLEPGTTFPQHYHPQDEETFVVDGETWFGDIHLKAGDYHLAPKGTTHGEVRTETGCTLLIRKASE